MLIISLALSLATNIEVPRSQQDTDITRLKSCAALSNDVQRLTCYDSVFRENSTQIPKTSFGLSKKSTPRSIKAPIKPELQQSKSESAADDKESSMMKKILGTIMKKDGARNQASFEVLSFKKKIHGRAVFTMKDGTVWEQIDSKRPRIRQEPFKATISRASLGSFLLKPDSGYWSMRVKRIK